MCIQSTCFWLLRAQHSIKEIKNLGAKTKFEDRMSLYKKKNYYISHTLLVGSQPCVTRASPSAGSLGEETGWGLLRGLALVTWNEGKGSTGNEGPSSCGPLICSAKLHADLSPTFVAQGVVISPRRRNTRAKALIILTWSQAIFSIDFTFLDFIREHDQLVMHSWLSPEATRFWLIFGFRVSLYNNQECVSVK